MADSTQKLQRCSNGARIQLGIIDPTTKVFTFVCIPPKSSGRKLDWNRGTLNDLWKWIETRNDQNYGIYVSANPGSGKTWNDKDVDRIRVVFVDHDASDDPERCALYEQFKKDYAPHLEVDTSPGKFQAWLRVDGVSIDDFKPIQHGFSDKYKTDPSVSNPGRLMRLVGCIHNNKIDEDPPSKPFVSRIAHMDPNRPPYTSEMLPRRERTSSSNDNAYTADGSGRTGGDNSGRIDPEVHKYIDKHVAALSAMKPKSGRNQELNKIAMYFGSLVHHGQAPEDYVGIVLLVACQRNGLIADDGIEQCRKTIKSGIEQGKAEPGEFKIRVKKEPEPPAPLVAQRFVARPEAELPRRDFLYGKHLIRGYVSVTGSTGGGGKTTLLVAETLSMTCGEDLLHYGHNFERPLNVWYISCEDPVGEMELRFRAAV